MKLRPRGSAGCEGDRPNRPCPGARPGDTARRDKPCKRGVYLRSKGPVPGPIWGQARGHAPAGRVTLRAELAVGLLERFRRADVVPLAGNRPHEEGRPRVQPLGQTAWLVGVVAFREVATDQRQHRTRIEVERDSRQGRLRLRRLLFKARYPAVGVRRDRAVTLDRLEVADVEDGDRRRVLVETEPRKIVETALAENAVAGRNDQVVVDELLSDHEVEVTDRAELVVVA